MMYQYNIITSFILRKKGFEKDLTTANIQYNPSSFSGSGYSTMLDESKAYLG